MTRPAKVPATAGLSLASVLPVVAMAFGLAPAAWAEPVVQPIPAPTAQQPAAAPSLAMAIDESANMVEFADRRALGRFFRRWQAGRESPVTIAHFGDSHVQNGWQVSVIRDRLQAARGRGGRGMVFPYALAKTYSQEDYSSSFTGTWRTGNSIQQPPRLPVGVSGFAAETADPYSSVALAFSRPPAPGPVTVSVAARVTGASYRLTLSNGEASQSQVVSPAAGPTIQQVRFELPQISYALKLDIAAMPAEAAASRAPANGGGAPVGPVSSWQLSTLPGGEVSGEVVQPIPAPFSGTFALHGLDLRNRAPGGLVYHNLGVGGAAYNALVQQRLFEQNFPSLGADLVILDWGTNDVLYTNTISPQFADTVRRTIQRIRAADPDVTILVTVPQDERFHRASVTSVAPLANILRQIAFEQNCLFYDWYRVSGGPNSMLAWSANGLASRDNIHLNKRGYSFKGELFAQALLRTIEAVAADPERPSLLRQ